MHIIIQIIGYFGCQFQSLTHIMKNNQKGCYHIRQSIVLHVKINCVWFPSFSENNNNKYPDLKSYYTHLSNVSALNLCWIYRTNGSQRIISLLF